MKKLIITAMLLCFANSANAGGFEFNRWDELPDSLNFLTGTEGSGYGACMIWATQSKYLSSESFHKVKPFWEMFSKEMGVTYDEGLRMCDSALNVVILRSKKATM